VDQGKEDAGDNDDASGDARGVDEVQERIEGGIPIGLQCSSHHQITETIQEW